MAQLILSNGFGFQPQYPAPLDASNPFAKDIKLAYSVGRGLQDGAHGLGSVTGTMNYGVGPKGRNVQPANSSSYIAFADNPDYNILGDITVIALVDIGGVTVQQAFINKCETNGGANTPFGLFVEIGGAISFNRANAGGFRVWASSATIASNTYVLAVTQVADMSVAPKFYINGLLDSGSPTSLYGGGGTGAATGNATSVKIGNKTDLASQLFGSVYDADVIARVLTASEVAALSANLYAIWQAPARRLWAVPAAGGAITLIGANSVEANTGGTGAISQVHILTGSPSAQANASATGAISQGLTLTGLSSKQSNASSTGAITQTHVLVVANSAQSNAASAGAITSGINLAIASSVQGNASAAAAITQVHILIGAGGAQINAGSTGALSGANTLIGAMGTQSNASSAGMIFEVYIPPLPDGFVYLSVASTDF